MLEPEVAKQLRAAGAEVESRMRSDRWTTSGYGWRRRTSTSGCPRARQRWTPASSGGSAGELARCAFRTGANCTSTGSMARVTPTGCRFRIAPRMIAVYLDALDIDYAAMATQRMPAIARLRAGEVRVTTPGGTDVRFQVGDRPFNRQTGHASKANARQGRIRIDRHTELPAGVMRVAPIET